MSDFFVAGRKPSHDEAAHALNWTDMLVSQGSQEAWSIPEAFLAILFAAVTCDGSLAAVEHEELLALAHRSRALKTLTVAQLAALNVRILERTRSGEAVLSNACATLPVDMRLPAFAHAFDLVLADGELNEDEADFLNGLILGLDLHREDVGRIVTVIELKNRF